MDGKKKTILITSFGLHCLNCSKISFTGSHKTITALKIYVFDKVNHQNNTFSSACESVRSPSKNFIVENVMQGQHKIGPPRLQGRFKLILLAGTTSCHGDTLQLNSSALPGDELSSPGFVTGVWGSCRYNC